MNNETVNIARNAYQAAVNEWIAAIRVEENTARNQVTVSDLDAWESTNELAEAEQHKVKAAKQAYQDALRETLFHF